MLPACGFSRFLTIHPQRPSDRMLPAGSVGNKAKTDVRKMANNLRIVGRIQGGHCVIINWRLENLFRPVPVCDGPKN
jgi:hypothetical protein